MLSAISASDALLGNPFASSAFDGGFPPWDCTDFFFAAINTSSSGSDDPNENNAKEKPGSEAVMDERKRRRKISNRESARRSRMRKQRHLENLRNQLKASRVENRELNNRLQLMVHHFNRVRTENDWLRSERTLLRQKLSYMTQILLFQQLRQQPFSSSAWPCNNVTPQ
ncbi:basic leucine zipper 43-like [Arachis stenosperma]|uniref:basic leucine zipper 43-like n=1 Tax=Arachis stenosperma TaxID=217475 RepID=UPI0025ACB6DE|nr:basic leucine zipper 43-like [Arachis stenosperma]